jgi:hypothetical protein
LHDFKLEAGIEFSTFLSHHFLRLGRVFSSYNGVHQN